MTDFPMVEGSRIHNWRNHVPDKVRAIWDSFTQDQRDALREWAEGLADSEEWE